MAHPFFGYWSTSPPQNAASNPTVTALAALLMGALTVMFGIQLLRMLFVGLSMYLAQVEQVSPVLVGLTGLAVFLCGFLEPIVRRVLGPRYALPVVAGSLGLVWLAEKIVSSPPLDLGFSMVGTVLFLWSLPLMFRSIRPTGGHSSAAHTVIALLMGLSVDAVMKGVFGFVDLSWSPGVGGYAVVAGLAAAQGAFLWLLASEGSQKPEQGLAASAMPYMVFGPALALHLILFQNVAHQTALIGWPQPAVYALVLSANFIAVVAAVELTRWDRRLPWPVLTLLGALLVWMTAVVQSGFAAVPIALAAQIAIAVSLVSIIKASGGPGGGTSERHVSIWFAVGMVILLALLFLYYGNYSVDLLIPKEAVLSLAALLVGITALRACLGAHTVKAPVTRAAVIPVAFLLVLPLVHLADWKDVEPTPGDGFPVRVMSYNLHQGFDSHGAHAMEDLAKVIEAEDPDIVALQEVSRGWVVNGSFDMLVWLSQRLEMDYVWGPAADPVWGNAVLSKLPITASQNHAMPNNHLIHLDRAFLTVEVDLGGGEILDVIATHFHHVRDGSAIRVQQALAVLEAVDSGLPTVLIGDLNARPNDPEMLLIANAGLNDAFVSSGTAGDGFTFPAADPGRRIDYIWASPDLKARDFSIPQSLASDHLAVVATLHR